MTSRPKSTIGGLRKVEHIEVYDMDGAMVAGEPEDPYLYFHQTQYYFGNNNISDRTTFKHPRMGKVGPTELNQLKKAVQRILQNPFEWNENPENNSWLDVSAQNGSTIAYRGENKDKFLQKVMGIEIRS